MKLPGTFADKKSHIIHVVIETPYKSRNKFEYDKVSGLFKLSKVIPAGLAFPCDMGFIPHTKGEDGDPLDALILMDELTYPGCFMECRILGVMKAEQTEKKTKKKRNDRFITVPAEMKEYDHLKTIYDLSKQKTTDLVDFFVNYNKREDKEFKVLSIGGPEEAYKLLNHSKV
jgi:inorganic pyrophosphatase